MASVLSGASAAWCALDVAVVLMVVVGWGRLSGMGMDEGSGKALKVSDEVPRLPANGVLFRLSVPGVELRGGKETRDRCAVFNAPAGSVPSSVTVPSFSSGWAGCPRVGWTRAARMAGLMLGWESVWLCG